MHIGCPREVKPQEFRVGLTPQAAHEAVHHGHQVTVETGAGVGAGFADDDYLAAGAQIADSAAEVWERADLVIKVKEPQAEEIPLLRPGQVLFAYLHLAPDPALTRALTASGATCIAYETVTGAHGGLPLLAPMSEVAGRLAPQVGAWAMQRANGGCGVLLGGVPGVRPANVLIIGGGVVGTAAARVSAGMSANVTVVDRSLSRLNYLDDIFMGRLITQFADSATIAELLPQADLVIGAVLVPGASTPRLVRREQLAGMRAGSVLVDVAVDQGGCFETSRPTTHEDPIYEVDGVLHYCVSNMPGAVSRTSTLALGNATLPFLLALADKGWQRACRDDIHLSHGVNIHAGHVTHAAVAAAQGLEFEPADRIIAA